MHSEHHDMGGRAGQAPVKASKQTVPSLAFYLERVLHNDALEGDNRDFCLDAVYSSAQKDDGCYISPHQSPMFQVASHPAPLPST